MKKIAENVARLAIIAVIFGQTFVFSQNSLTDGFQNPPNAARPRVWWHWLNGNVTKEGIQKDLEWMNRVGIGGFQNFDANLLTPQIVDKRLVYMSPEWKDAFKFTMELANKFGMETAIAASPGWSESGGPWVEAKDGMKKYVWSATRIKGGQSFNGKLPPPPNVTGAFQNVPFAEEAGLIGAVSEEKPKFYEDAAVVAYRQPDADVPLRDLKPKITSSGGQFDINQLTDGDLAAANYLPPTDVGDNAWIQFEFDRPQTFKALTMTAGEVVPQFQTVPTTNALQASDDGVNFREVMTIPATRVPQNTIDFAPVTAKFFRFVFKTLPPQPNQIALMMGLPQGELKPKGTNVAEIVLHTAYQINHLEEKGAFTPSGQLANFVTPNTTDAIPAGDLIDLTSKMKPDGTLEWTPPAGNWIVLRMGYSLLGITNHPATPEATGLEVDKLDQRAVKDYFENYLDQYQTAIGGLMGQKGLRYMVTDSYEAGGANWTQNLPAEFRRRRGYDMNSWLPVLTGKIVKSSGASEQFLWDFRRTLSELMAENHYDQLTEILRRRGMGRYSESHESGRAMIADGMEVKRRAAVPMSAMWTPSIVNGGDQTVYQADIRESASVAHIYGQNLVAAESLTAFGLFGKAWSYAPETLKPTADLELANGLNRFVIHTSVHQPSNTKIPGISLGPFGQWFTRHETWAEQSKAWIDYLSRSAYLLQQGKFTADILYFYGEDNNITSLFEKKLPAIPAGYNYDFVNADALINVLQVKNGKIITPSGMSYEFLFLGDNAKNMSLPVLRKIREMVKNGATVAGIKPEKSPSLSDDQAEFARFVKEIWNADNSKVSSNQPLEKVLQTKKIQPDFSYVKPQADSNILYVHRTLPDQEIYWVNNRQNRVEELEASFRTAGRVPEIWRADTGKTEKVSYQIKDGRTVVPLAFEPNEAYFVVFRDKAATDSYALPKKNETAIAELNGAWKVAFQPNRGAPPSAVFNRLESWTENKDAGIKYFSGTANYQIAFDLPNKTDGAAIMLDLGAVKNLAEVFVNGKNAGIVWKPPFKIDVTNLVKTGANDLEIRITNLWVNRLIGDEQPGASDKITYTSMKFFQATTPLQPSGLLGPVKILERK